MSCPARRRLLTTRCWRLMLLRLAYLGIINAFALLRLLRGSDRDKDAEILALRHQLAVLQRQLDGQRVRFDPADRAWLAALLYQLPRPSLHRLRLLVRPDTVLRWHRDLLARRHAVASRPRRAPSMCRRRPPGLGCCYLPSRRLSRASVNVCTSVGGSPLPTCSMVSRMMRWTMTGTSTVRRIIHVGSPSSLRWLSRASCWPTASIV